MIIEIGKVKYNFDLPPAFPLSANDIDRLNRVVSQCLLSVSESSDLRIIVIETWMIIDYYVRHILEQFFSISQLACEKLDPKYDLLPDSFSTCLKMLRTIFNAHRELPIKKPEPPEIIMPARIFRDMQKSNPDLLKSINEFTDRYKKSDSTPCTLEISLYPFNQCYQHPLVKMFEFINADWFAGAEKINKARNKAAHIYDINAIYKKLGINGDNAFEQSKSFCLDLIYKTCFVSICEDQTVVAEIFF